MKLFIDKNTIIEVKIEDISTRVYTTSDTEFLKSLELEKTSFFYEPINDYIVINETVEMWEKWKSIIIDYLKLPIVKRKLIRGQADEPIEKALNILDTVIYIRNQNIKAI